MTFLPFHFLNIWFSFTELFEILFTSQACRGIDTFFYFPDFLICLTIRELLLSKYFVGFT